MHEIKMNVKSPDLFEKLCYAEMNGASARGGVGVKICSGCEVRQERFYRRGIAGIYDVAALYEKVISKASSGELGGVYGRYHIEQPRALRFIRRDKLISRGVAALDPLYEIFKVGGNFLRRRYDRDLAAQDIEHIVYERRDAARMIAVSVGHDDGDVAVLESGKLIRSDTAYLKERGHREIHEHKLVPAYEKGAVVFVGECRSSAEKLKHLSHIRRPPCSFRFPLRCRDVRRLRLYCPQWTWTGRTCGSRNSS